MIAPRPAEISSELAMFAGVVEEIAERHVEPVAAEIDRTASIPPQTLELLTDNELLVAGLPRDAGGGDGGDLAAVLLVERLAAASGAVAGVTAISHVCGVMVPQLTPHLVEHTDVLLVASGPGELSLSAEENGTFLRGHAPRVESAGEAATMIVLAESAGGPAVVTLPAAAPGVRWAEPADRTGLRGLATRAVDFTDVRVEADAIADDETLAGTGKRLELLLGAALCCGIGRAAVTLAGRYLEDRRQFGQRLSEFASLRAMMSTMAVDVTEATLLTFDAAARTDLSAAARAAASAMAAAVAVAIDAVQLHGGYGWTVEYPVERLMRDAASARARLGGSRATVEPIAGTLLAAR